MTSNETEGVCYPQPHTFEDRVAIARDFTQRSAYMLPLYVDRADDAAEDLYAGWPERLYVIEHGVIAYKGGPGPFEYDPEEVQAWLEQRFGN